MAKQGFDHPRWQIEKSLDEGGQGWAYLARDTTGEHSDLVVLKRLKNSSRSGRFAREVTALTKLSHKGIIGVLDHAPLDATEGLYLVMPYAAGGSLAKRPKLYEGLIDASLLVAEQLALALAHAHASGIVHRDVKPENILFWQENKHDCVLSDFGICFNDDGSTVTEANEWVGPRAYIAPELEGGGTPTPAADVYSLGKVIYFMLSGGITLPREEHRQPTYDLFAKGSKFRALGILLDQMLCRIEKRIAQISHIATRLERIRAVDLEDASVPLGAGAFASIAAAVGADRERKRAEDDRNAVIKVRRERIRIVLEELHAQVAALVRNAVLLLAEQSGDIVKFEILPATWEAPCKSMGQQGASEGLDVETTVAFSVTRSTGTMRRHTLAFCCCRIERRVTIVRDGNTYREDSDGKVAVIPLCSSPDNPTLIGFLASRDRVPPHYDPAIGRSRVNQKFFADQRQLGLYLKTSEWPAKADGAKALVGEAIELFMLAALAEPPWPIGTTDR